MPIISHSLGKSFFIFLLRRFYFRTSLQRKKFTCRKPSWYFWTFYLGNAKSSLMIFFLGKGKPSIYPVLAFGTPFPVSGAGAGLSTKYWVRIWRRRLLFEAFSRLLEILQQRSRAGRCCGLQSGLINNW